MVSMERKTNGSFPIDELLDVRALPADEKTMLEHRPRVCATNFYITRVIVLHGI